MDEAIEQPLTAIERDHMVRTPWVCESGSSARGFPSADSDYDVRFVYPHERDWYLSVFRRRDVIELPLTEDLLDVSGWDLRDALGLLRKSNAALMEWLSSPIVYRRDTEALALLQRLAERAFQPARACHIQFSMARASMAQWADRRTVSLRKYLYSLRPPAVLPPAIQHGTQPPMAFAEFAEAMIAEPGERRTVRKLVAVKTSGHEAETIERDTALEAYLQRFTRRRRRRCPTAPDNAESGVRCPVSRPSGMAGIRP